MRDRDLFQQALGLASPWRVVRSTFDAERQRLDLYLDFPPGSAFDCPSCSSSGCKVHDTEEKSWRHLNFFQHQAYLHARTPRIRCETCGVRRVEVPWARPGSGFTLLFEALVMTLVKEMPVAAIARMVGEHDTRLWRIIHHYVEEARALVDCSGVRSVGLDEKASRRGHSYLTLFVDLETARLLYATASREASTLREFRRDLEEHGGVGERIEEFEELGGDDLCAFIPVHKKDPNINRKQGWKMPAPGLLKRLVEKTDRRVLQMDGADPGDCDPRKPPAKRAWKRINVQPEIDTEAISISIE